MTKRIVFICSNQVKNPNVEFPVGYYLPEDELETIITAGKKQRAHYYTLLGGEPMMYPKLLDIFAKHRDCYFQVITNGMLFNEANVKHYRKSDAITEFKEFIGRSHYTLGQEGWEEVADFALDWAVSHAAPAPVA